jgi:hypothetical protein
MGVENLIRELIWESNLDVVLILWDEATAVHELLKKRG